MLFRSLENHRRYAAADYQFSHDKFTHTLNLLKRPLYDSTVLVDCYVNLEDEEYMQVDWVLRWAVSEAKLMLGAAYRKFQTVAAPTGEVGLSGSEYIQEAREEQRVLNEEVDSIVSGSPDYYGVYII